MERLVQVDREQLTAQMRAMATDHGPDQDRGAEVEAMRKGLGETQGFAAGQEVQTKTAAGDEAWIGRSLQNRRSQCMAT
jgi:hypothetical protein